MLCIVAVGLPMHFGNQNSYFAIVGYVATRGVTTQNNALSVATIFSMGILGVIESNKSRSRQRVVATLVRFIVS